MLYAALVKISKEICIPFVQIRKQPHTAEYFACTMYVCMFVYIFVLTLTIFFRMH